MIWEQHFRAMLISWVQTFTLVVVIFLFVYNQASTSSAKLPMKKNFELYILTDDLTADHWRNLYKALTPHVGRLKTFELILDCSSNVIRFFISSDKDLSVLSNSIDGFLLRAVDKSALELPVAGTRERFVQFVTGGNILDLKEKLLIKKGLDIHYAAFIVRPMSAGKALVTLNFYCKRGDGRWSKISKAATFFPAGLLAIDFSTNTHYLKKSVPKYLNIEKSLHLLTSDNNNALFKVDTFPYLPHDYYLNLTGYDFDRHSFIIGASGSGKSKFISLFVDRLYNTALRLNYRVIVIDPHAAIAPDFEHISDAKFVNFNSESTQLFGGAAADISAATELTATLFKSLMNEQYNPKVDRVLRFSLFVLFTAQNMSLDTLKRFLTDIDLRGQIVQHVSGYVPANIVQFFGADFNDMRTKYYNEAISPIISLVDEMQLQPVLVGEGELSLAKTIQDNFLTVFSLNKVSMGERVVKTVAGLLIQQIFLLAQARAFSQKLILIIDEVSVIQSPALASILAEARKFNLSVILTQQYFGQIDKDLRDAIFSNVYNYYAFKVSEEDARNLEGNLNIELAPEVMEEEHKKGLKEQDVRVKIMTELHPRECLVRVLSGGQIVPAVKARTVDAPVPSNQPATTENLQAYQHTAAALPEKFHENASPLVGAPAATAPAPPEPIAGASAAQSTRSAGLFNLSDLLAQNSSSRIDAKRKDRS